MRIAMGDRTGMKEGSPQAPFNRKSPSAIDIPYRNPESEILNLI